MTMCWACNINEATEQHHLWPIHLNGPKNGPLFCICGNCHHDIHLLANRILKNKPIEKNYNNKVKLLADAIVKATTSVRETEHIDNATIRLVINMPASLRKALHRKKMDSGFTNLENYILTILKKYGV